MSYKVSILYDAEIDIDDAYIWYELRQIDLGNSFFKSVNESVVIISNSPFSCAEIYKGIRRFVIKRFPYGIYYRVISEKREIQILGVVHFKRNTRIVKKRFKSPEVKS